MGTIGRPPTKGLQFYKKDISYYEDGKIIDLLDEYGPAGCIVFDVLLTAVYREGYYLATPLDSLVRMIIKTIGNRWVKKELVQQVIDYCAEIGLLHDGLLHQGIITSAGIQKRYAEVTARNKVNKDLHWLLDECQVSESVPETQVSEAEIGLSATESQYNAVETHIREDEIREEDTNISSNANALIIPDGLREAWNGFVAMRKKIKKPLTDRAVTMILNKLEEFAPDDALTQSKILDQSTLNVWQTVYPLKEKGGKRGEKPKPDYSDPKRYE